MFQQLRSEARRFQRPLTPPQAPQFKAQPLPDFDTVVLPEKRKQEPTKQEPFRLLTDVRGAVSSSRWEQMVRSRLARRRRRFPPLAASVQT